MHRARVGLGKVHSAVAVGITYLGVPPGDSASALVVEPCIRAAGEEPDLKCAHRVIP